MRKIKTISLLLTLLFTGNILFAQSIDEGKRFLYYERYNSAKDIFNRLLTANPNNVDAAYWLGQTYLASDDSVSAKALYQKTLGTNPNAPLMLVAMGQIALMDRQSGDARNRFETAISLTKAKDYNILNAIARANVDARYGDATYAIEKIKAIPENKRTAEMWTTLGDAYRKLTDGANAVTAYQSALGVDPNYAKASFMTGRIYQTQGTAQEPYYMRYYNEAMTKDPKYAPLYSWLSVYYYNRDINKAREYLDKYIANADTDSKNCYYQASFMYASRQYQQTITKANECIAAGGQNPYPSLYGLKAFAYDKLGDSVNAKTFFETYFQKQKPENLLSGDYAKYGQVLLKFPGNEVMAANYIQKAITLDTLEDNKIEYITSVAKNYEAAKNYNEAGNWYARLLGVKKNPTKTDLYNAGINYYRGVNYKSSDSLFKIYQQKYPDDVLGWYYGAIVKANMDSSSALGLAAPDYLKLIEVAAKLPDTVRGKQLQITGYRYFVNYNYNVKKDKAATLDVINKILAIDPADQMALDNKKALTSGPVKVKVDDDKVKTKTATTKEKVEDDKTKIKTSTTKEKTTSTKTKVKDK
ncbi:MAG TPA: tetratricopeptide repeat protein [Chitinophagaceae bacterium]|nr:tetratricopeptide repeat protein [Chitinophagaceae bacterium]